MDAVAGGRLPHAWLISGPEGTGKATLAYRFARYLLAHPPGDSAADGGLFAADDIPTDGIGSMHMEVDVAAEDIKAETNLVKDIQTLLVCLISCIVMIVMD